MRKLNLKKIIIVVVLTITILAFALCFGALAKTSKSVDASSVTVVLDAGHGGIDGGVTGVKTGVSESKLNLEVTKKLETLFLSAGINVVLTRTDDNGLYGVYGPSFKKKDMESRKKIIMKAEPNIVISIHMNKYSVSTRRGAQTFFNPENEYSISLANSIQSSLNSMEEAVKKTNALKGDYYILNSHNYPGCIVECGFLSNPEDEALLITSEYQQKIAYAIFKGAINYLTETTFYTQYV